MALFEKGELYEGYFKNDLAYGAGRYIYIDGSYYEGKWSNGLKHGTGVQISETGEEVKGQWINGSIKDDKKEIMVEQPSVPSTKSKTSTNVRSHKGSKQKYTHKSTEQVKTNFTDEIHSIQQSYNELTLDHHDSKSHYH